MEIALVAILIISITTLGAFVVSMSFVFSRIREMRNAQLSSQSDKLVGMMNENISKMQSRIDKTTESLNSRLDNAAKVIGQVQHELGGMKEIGRSISDFQAFLKSPKIRGNLGEAILYDTLGQAFSNENYSKQYKFKDGQVVDAVLHTSAGIIPIDSKFPMDAFQRCVKAESEHDQKIARKEFVNAVRKHIRDVSTKYILPQEGTVNFSVMYVPSEAVYYEIMQEHEDLHMYAHEYRVMVVSPNTFSHFLQVVLMGIERSKLHEQAKRIWEILKGVQKETRKFGDRLSVLHRHITNAKGAMDTVSGEYMKLSGKVDEIKLIDAYDKSKERTKSGE
ncbi:hypothetical protein A3B32_02625 [Candidatus Uhrbacteria bacterium RIFCSPLOWO2_01_FULL_53_9]|uniref:DNA recombination protein RmuC n=3 Tax=Candidatus Uhriibacteriota TaxID=1752732 RepID=A0A1F7UWK1_9BACT|nr:MAG: hypothetical protein A3B32_02625 [Candidatus Uhrbacteria bacterium RIFCSPLOWO2_01_FULL_53_9]OGL89835.1 MAG: hypothetical protein A3I45_00065 [Candidatus Uhrbacteria bacterium RIFCSPLOWO2_02_FULL_53_10]